MPASGPRRPRSSLNGTRVAGFGLNDLRHRYRVPLPTTAQRIGDNRLRFVFSADASPADADPKNADKRRLAAAFYSLVVGSADDEGLDDLLGRDAPRPFSVPDTGVPSLAMVGPAGVRYAIRLPEGAELRFTPDLVASARAAAGAAAFRVTLEERAGEERTLWSRTITGRDPASGEVSVPLPGQPGSIVRLGLHVGAVARESFRLGAVGRAARSRARREMARAGSEAAGGARARGRNCARPWPERTSSS